MPETADTGLIARTETRDLGKAPALATGPSTTRSPGRRGRPGGGATGAGTG